MFTDNLLITQYFIKTNLISSFIVNSTSFGLVPVKKILVSSANILKESFSEEYSDHAMR